jgi:putative transposase
MIQELGEQFPITRLCQMLSVSPSGYYAWRKRPLSAREMANQKLMEQIRAVYTASYGTYGSPRIYRELQAQCVVCSRNRVARLMRLYGLRARQFRRYRVCTKRNQAHRPAPNLLSRDFAAARPNQRWLCDITCVRTAEGWLYVALVMDLYSRFIVGWAMSDRMTSNLAKAAIRMAFARRQPERGLLHHSDQGSQYTDRGYQALLAAWSVQVSMNGAGTWYDNSPMESLIGTVKSEWTHRHEYLTRAEAKTDIFFYIEVFYNRTRRHSSLDYHSPEEYEQIY